MKKKEGSSGSIDSKRRSEETVEEVAIRGRGRGGGKVKPSFCVSDFVL
ncbi:unnamed protein product [Onchocerca flexuosa]|uniref:Uncharacterized protein n=1 Tax=Onchocerca flexuosa TaxID=387005 RepID=A0A183I4Q2_9BILA|nr:unnamed protein product [Onchocerca flexuosa]